MGSDPPASGSALPPCLKSNPSQKSPWFAPSTNSPARNSVSCEVVNGIAKFTIPAYILSNAQPLWTNYIVGYFIGDAPHIRKVHATVNRHWSNQEKPSKIDAQFINSKTVLFRINNAQIRERVLKRHFWHISDIPLVVQEWNPRTSSHKPDLSAMPIWVDLLKVPDSLYSEKALMFLESEIIIPISYPWLPPRCSRCLSWGHLEKECSQLQKGASISAEARDSHIRESPLRHSQCAQNVQSDLRGDDHIVTAPGTTERVKIQEDLALPETETFVVSVKDQENSGTITRETEIPWTEVSKTSRRSPAKQRESSKSPTTSPSKFNVLANLSEEEDEVEEGEILGQKGEPPVVAKSSEKVEMEQLEQRELAPAGGRNHKNKSLIKNDCHNKIPTSFPAKTKQKSFRKEALMIMSSFFAWNTRGLNKMRKHNVVRSWVQTVRPAFGCLLETLVQEATCPNILDTVFTRWSSTTNYDFHRIGRIWVIWSDAVSISPLHKSPQVITIEVTYASGLSFVCSCVYASNFSNDRRVLWQELRGTNEYLQGINTPWIIMGDFNQTLSSDEHSRAADYLGDQSAMRDFQQFVTDCEVMDLGYVGSQFTWLNQQEENPIGKKLDRALVNNACSIFPQSFAAFETNGISDHARCVIWLDNNVTDKHHHFQFFKFLETVNQVWRETPPLFHYRSALHRFHRKLKSLKVHLRALNRSRYGDITRRTSEAFDNLCEKQQQALQNPSSENIAAADAASSLWHHYSEIEERFFQQKSRITWLKNGD
ncbi:uncharacterized protein LOC112082955 [Eutrema salsugineum]|uniref:uncharacterized protein LOC112082955 n=1 Tax=Eutrema salsugineum TaxID=72664 RepID=UPI000CED2665|nr:uncharacterized protein LOC112082955 [Eutrema salsugineum]